MMDAESGMMLMIVGGLLAAIALLIYRSDDE